MKKHSITPKDREDIKEVLNSKHNLEALPAGDNMRKGRHIRRAIKDGSCMHDDKVGQKQSLKTALQAQKHLLHQKELMTGKSKKAKTVIKNVGKNIEKMLK